MEKVDITIVGAGAVGLAIAAELEGEGREIIIVERHDGFGREASSRNSEVIHAGIYYPAGSLKAGLCVKGRELLYRFCDRHGIRFKKTGKMIIAVTPEQTAALEKLKERGETNGVEGLRLLSGSEAARLEPHVKAEAGLLSPETGIFDTHSFMAQLERKASRSATFAYNCEAESLRREGGEYVMGIRDADGEEYLFGSRVVINAAGLGAERMARAAGIDTARAGYGIHPCKGEYFRVWGAKEKAPRHLIYPPPTKISLGVHTVIDLEGGLKLGPNAFYVDEIDYAVDESHRREFFESAREYLPWLREDDISPDMSGIRPKIFREGEDERDFVIRHEDDRGLPGLISLVGIESPGLTSSLAIARRVGAMVREIL